MDGKTDLFRQQQDEQSEVNSFGTTYLLQRNVIKVVRSFRVEFVPCSQDWLTD